MTTFHALTMPDGSVAVMQVVEGADLDEAIRKFADVNPAPVSVRAIALVDIPADRTFRDAWRDTGAKIEHDMAACRALHMARIRKARDAELKRLDVAFMRAVENDDAIGRGLVAATKQVLRDLPATFDLSSAATVDDLKARWPGLLPRE